MNYQEEPLGITRRRKIFSIGIIITDTIEWTGKWFKWVAIEEELHKVRYKEFDDGWTYMHYWGKWKAEWKFKKIL